MEYKAWFRRWYAIWLLIYIFFCSNVHSSNNITDKTLDAFLDDLVMKAPSQHQPRTGALYKAPLPSNLAGMQISAVRLRSRTLWYKGANFSNIQIPPRTLPIPHAKRLLIVYQDLGNWSSHCFSITGYSLMSSVVGFMVYDASNPEAKNISKLQLNTMGKQILIQFPGLMFPEGNAPKTKCAIFGTDGKIDISDTSLPNVCYSRGQGHFSIVAPVKRKEHGVWGLWVIGFVLGFVGLLLIGFIGMIFVRVMEAKKIQKMEEEADKGVVLGTTWIGRSKMPRAAVTRTNPVLETAAGRPRPSFTFPFQHPA